MSQEVIVQVSFYHFLYGYFFLHSYIFLSTPLFSMQNFLTFFLIINTCDRIFKMEYFYYFIFHLMTIYLLYFYVNTGKNSMLLDRNLII